MENDRISMSWDKKYDIGSMWIREKETFQGSEAIFGFADWGSVHSHRVWNLNGSVIYDRTVSGINLPFIGSR